MLKEIVSNALIKQREGKEHKDKLYPTFSSCYVKFSKYKKLYGKCLRASYYSCIGKEGKTDETLNSALKKELGKYAERMIVSTFQKEKILKDKSVKFYIDKYKISGEVDAIVTLNDKDYGVEIKTIGGDNEYINNLIYSNSTPKWENLFQTLIYCYAFKDTLPNGFIIFYLRRDTGEIKEIRVQIEPYQGKLVPVINGKIDNRYTINDILDRYKLLSKFIEANKVPPKEYMDIYPSNMIPSFFTAGLLSKKQVEAYNVKPFGDMQCRFCEYKDICKEDE